MHRTIVFSIPVVTLRLTILATACLWIHGGSIRAQAPTLSPAQTPLRRFALPADIAFPANNGGATIGGAPVGWSRAVTLSDNQANGFDQGRCIYGLAYHISNIGAGPAGGFSDMVRAVAVDPAGAPAAAMGPPSEQTGLTLGPQETKLVQTTVAIAPGTWYIVARADIGGQVLELDEVTNNEAKFRVTQVGKCGVTWGPDSPAEYRMYLLQHLVLRQITVASLGAPGPGGMLHVDSRTLAHASDGTCQLDLDYQVENHGGTATQAFKSGARVGMPPTSAVQLGMPQLAQGAAAPAHVVLSLREGGNTLAIHPVVITTGGGAELYGVNSQSMTVMVDGSCQPKRPE